MAPGNQNQNSDMHVLDVGTDNFMISLNFPSDPSKTQSTVLLNIFWRQDLLA